MILNRAQIKVLFRIIPNKICLFFKIPWKC